MNCKEGDIALCIKGEHAGKVCEVVARGNSYWEIPTGRLLDGWHVAFPREVQWGQVHQPDMAAEGWYPDEWLKPLRGGDGEDETLHWAPALVKEVV
ncbi:hypothetical protein GCM10027082_24370 [Comamonas humi]